MKFLFLALMLTLVLISTLSCKARNVQKDRSTLFTKDQENETHYFFKFSDGVIDLETYRADKTTTEDFRKVAKELGYLDWADYLNGIKKEKDLSMCNDEELFAVIAYSGRAYVSLHQVMSLAPVEGNLIDLTRVSICPDDEYKEGRYCVVEKDLKASIPQIKMVASGINCLQGQILEKSVFRGEMISSSDLENYIPGRVFLRKTFISTSKVEAIGQKWARPVIFEIKNFRGSYIGFLSFSKSEEEILLRAGSVFRVISREKEILNVPNIDGNKEIIRIKIEQQ